MSVRSLAPQDPANLVHKWLIYFFAAFLWNIEDDEINSEVTSIHKLLLQVFPELFKYDEDPAFHVVPFESIRKDVLREVKDGIVEFN